MIACDTSGTLQETLHRLEDLDLDAVQVGERHLLLPARQVQHVLERLKEHGQFPRLIGRTREEEATAPAVESDESEAEA